MHVQRRLIMKVTSPSARKRFVIPCDFFTICFPCLTPEVVVWGRFHYSLVNIFVLITRWVQANLPRLIKPSRQWIHVKRKYGAIARIAANKVQMARHRLFWRANCALFCRLTSLCNLNAESWTKAVSLVCHDLMCPQFVPVHEYRKEGRILIGYFVRYCL